MTVAEVRQKEIKELNGKILAIKGQIGALESKENDTAKRLKI